MDRKIIKLSVVLFLLLLSLSAWSASAQVLASGELVITGARLEVSPDSQEIDPGRPTAKIFTAKGAKNAKERD